MLLRHPAFRQRSPPLAQSISNVSASPGFWAALNLLDSRNASALEARSLLSCGENAADMRLWSVHPKYLDSKGLVALWRETLLAQAVLHGETRGYTQHPQLDRFKHSANPKHALSAYLRPIHEEAMVRGYCFDRAKIRELPALTDMLPLQDGQLRYEWLHLTQKLKQRDPQRYFLQKGIVVPEAHPLFVIVAGEMEAWERPAPLQKN